MRRTAAGEIVIIPVEDIESWFPEAAAYHRNCGHRTVWHFPFQVGGEVVGFLGLAFREAKSPNDVLRETVQALAHQASLALESQRLAERVGEHAREAGQREHRLDRLPHAQRLARHADGHARRAPHEVVRVRREGARVEHPERRIEGLHRLDSTYVQRIQGGVWMQFHVSYPHERLWTTRQLVRAIHISIPSHPKELAAILKEPMLFLL